MPDNTGEEDYGEKEGHEDPKVVVPSCLSDETIESGEGVQSAAPAVQRS